LARLNLFWTTLASSQDVGVSRICTDAIADDLFTTDRIAGENLKREGVAETRIHFVGNVMIDSLIAHLEIAERLAYHQTLGLAAGAYATLTLHRPSNVEDPATLARILDTIAEALPTLPVIFTIHPRTRARVEAFGLDDRFSSEPSRLGLFLTEPLGYGEFLSLNQSARLVLTDSGGLQEETTILGVPCVTLRENTERPITVEEGSNHLAGVSREGILDAIGQTLAFPLGSGRRPEKWDGRAAERIVDVITSGR